MTVEIELKEYTFGEGYNGNGTYTCQWLQPQTLEEVLITAKTPEEAKRLYNVVMQARVNPHPAVGTACAVAAAKHAYEIIQILITCDVFVNFTRESLLVDLLTKYPWLQEEGQCPAPR